MADLIDIEEMKQLLIQRLNIAEDENARAIAKGMAGCAGEKYDAYRIQLSNDIRDLHRLLHSVRCLQAFIERTDEIHDVIITEERKRVQVLAEKLNIFPTEALA